MPLITADIPGVGGKIKVCDEDFFVEEIPLYKPSGQGSHLYIQIEKKGISTPNVIVQIARGLGISRQKIGHAGLKDARAVTRQWISIEHIEPEDLQNLRIPRVKFQKFTHHKNKIKMGHLAGNRFVINLRELSISPVEAAERAERIMEIMCRLGVPNYFGPQRFGKRNDSNLVGEALIKGDRERFIDLFLGKPDPAELPSITEARTFYEQGNYEKAYYCWPDNYHDQLRVLRALRQGKSKQEAFNAIDKHFKRFFISAFQSELFNRVVSARMPAINKLMSGDMAYIHNKGACFMVENATTEQPRCDTFEISPTGPMFGNRNASAQGQPGQIEQDILDQAHLTTQDFDRMNSYKVRGGRRPLRFQPRNPKIRYEQDNLGPYLQLYFELDAGCYATTVIHEITK